MTAHYDVEDVPPNDVDTQVQLFEQANQTVKDGAVVAEQIRSDAEQVLGSIFHAVDKAGDRGLANRVNDVWEQVQTLTTVAVRQGANGAITALKEQRDKVLKELNGIKEAIENVDTGHEALAEFVEELESSWEEDSWYYYEDTAYDSAWENLREDMSGTLAEHGKMSRPEARTLFDLLASTPGNLTDEQKDLLKQLGATLREPAEEATSDTSE